jgi:predicted lipase
MLGDRTVNTLGMDDISKEEILDVIEQGYYNSVIGHQDVADYIGIPMNRVNTKLEIGDVLYVVQYVGGRLEEGSISVPDENYRFFKVWIMSDSDIKEIAGVI